MHRELDQPGIWHGQECADRTVHGLLGGKVSGFFIDLATNQPIVHSNTRTLERDFEWRGLCIEPNPAYHAPILRQRSCVLVPFAVADNVGTATFLMQGAVGGFIGQQGVVGDRQQNANADRSNVTVITLPLSRVLQWYAHSQIDYMSLDIEGAEHLAMRSFPWAAHNVSLITVERPNKELKHSMMSHGYAWICNHGNFGDEMWAHESLPIPILPPDSNPAMRRCLEGMQAARKQTLSSVSSWTARDSRHFAPCQSSICTNLKTCGSFCGPVCCDWHSKKDNCGYRHHMSGYIHVQKYNRKKKARDAQQPF